MLHKKLKDYFIPHEGNSYAPHGLQKAALFGMLIMIVLSFTIANVQSLVWISSKFMVSSVLPGVIVDLTNKERTTDSLGALHRSALLDEAANLKAQDMAKNEYFAHYSPAGLSPWYWFKKVSYNFVNAGENLAIQFTDSSAIVDAWMASPEHRANILNGKYTEIGVGTAEGMYQGYHTIYVVQLFGTPAEAAIPAPSAPDTATASAPTPAVASSNNAQSSSSVLAESVSVSEQVRHIPADPVPSEVSAPKVQTSTSTATTSTSSVVMQSSSTAEGSAQEVEATDNGVFVYSDFIATSTNAVAAPTQKVSGSTELRPQAPFFLRLITEPHTVLQILYILIGLFVFSSLLLSIFIEIKHQQPLQIAYGVALLFLMFGLFYIQTILGIGAVIV